MKSTATILPHLLLLSTTSTCLVQGFGLTNDMRSQVSQQRQQQQLKISNTNENENEDEDEDESHLNTRREAMKHLFQTSILGITALTSIPQESKGACLAGDTSHDCIGIYKVPIDDNISHMVSTPEQLAKYAPDLRWTPPIEYPTNYNNAKEEIMALKDQVQALVPLVSKGDLTSAGVEILRIVPRITVAGRVVIGSLQEIDEFSMKAMRSELAHSEVLASLGSADVLIGQQFAGQFGSITVAQIQILEDLRDANLHYEELVKAMPTDYLG